MSPSRTRQRRKRNDLEAQPVEQVGAEASFLGQPGQVLVGRGDDADVDPQRARRADPGDLAIFDRAQQAFLRGHRQGRQFVEEQGAAVGLLEPPRARPGSAGERAGLVAEQFGLDQRFGQRARSSW